MGATHDNRGQSQRRRPLSLPDLTLARGSTATLRAVLARELGARLRAFAGLPMRLLPPQERSLYTAAASLLQALAGRDRGAALAILREPTVGGLLATLPDPAGGAGGSEARDGRGTTAAEDGRVTLEARLRQLCLHVLLELAVRGALPEAGVDWQAGAAAPAPLASIAANLALHFDAPIQSLTFAPGRLEVNTAHTRASLSLQGPLEPGLPGLRVLRPYHTVVPGVFLATHDNNPLADLEAHPDKDGNRLDLGAKPLAAWIEALGAAFGLVATHLPLLYEELRLIGRLVVPVGFDAERHLSASYQEVIGTAYMTLHPDPMTMCEAVIHELQHSKLNAALNLDPLVRNARWPLYSSPVRPDPRPLHGVLLAVHAFQPVAALYRAMLEAGHPLARQDRFAQRLDAIIASNEAGARTVLAHAQPTEAGRGLLAEMARLRDEAGAWGRRP